MNSNTQVRFYSVQSVPGNANPYGIYFAEGGELYKGSVRFGLGRVTDKDNLSSIPNPGSGDMNITSETAYVFDGRDWKEISAKARAYDYPVIQKDGESATVSDHSINVLASTVSQVTVPSTTNDTIVLAMENESISWNFDGLTTYGDEENVFVFAPPAMFMLTNIGNGNILVGRKNICVVSQSSV